MNIYTKNNEILLDSENQIYLKALVTDGLLVYLDAKEYDNNGEYWNDISGNDNHFLFEDFFGYDPTYNSVDQNFRTHGQTIDEGETIAKPSGFKLTGSTLNNFTGSIIIVFNNNLYGNMGGQSRVLISEGDGSRFVAHKYDNTHYFDGIGSPIFYINNELKDPAVPGNYPPQSLNQIQVDFTFSYTTFILFLYRALGSFNYDVDAYSVLIYNRVLTEAERLSNYYYLKSRFLNKLPVTDGLFTYLDAKEYDNNGSYWNDISGNDNHFDFVNYGNLPSFDNTNKKFIINNSSFKLTYDIDFSLSTFFFVMKNNQSAYSTIYCVLGNLDDGTYNNDPLIYYYNTNEGDVEVGPYSEFSQSGQYSQYPSLKVNNSFTPGYGNDGVLDYLMFLEIGNLPTDQFYDNIVLFNGTLGDYTYNADVYAVLIYNRVLTAGEKTLVYEYFKSRFNIPE